MTFTIALMMILMYGLSVNMRNTAVHLILQMIWLSSSMMHITAEEILSVNAIMVRAGVQAVPLRLQNIFTIKGKANSGAQGKLGHSYYLLTITPNTAFPG